ncbi:1796_t:CDS:1 [Acaulospora colombiana]|uniref:1796_t:CDS:1 n=1 Tax=Acaulospora colombiana TaxID=27376 RepID=A0ACA9L3V8_9GLOM|nr:1796_t:CDS:1 [Acaulospora colombiana]
MFTKGPQSSLSLAKVILRRAESSFSPPPLIRKLRKKDYKKLLAAEFRKENARRREEALQRKAQKQREMTKGQDHEVADTANLEGFVDPPLPIKMGDRLPGSKIRMSPEKKARDPSSAKTIFIDGMRRTVPIIYPPKTSKSYKNNDTKRFKDELKLKRFEYKLELGLATTTSNIESKDPAPGVEYSGSGVNVSTTKTDLGTSNETSVSATPQDLLKNQRMWNERMRAEREAHFKKLRETSGILSLTSNEPFIPDGYKDRKREIGFEKYNALQSMKRQDRLNHLISLYHSASDFVTLNNLDAKIEEAFGDAVHFRRVYTSTLDDMQKDYQEMGGISVEEARKRLLQIQEILDGTSRGRPGLDMIETSDSSVEHTEAETKEDKGTQDEI